MRTHGRLHWTTNAKKREQCNSYKLDALPITFPVYVITALS